MAVLLMGGPGVAIPFSFFEDGFSTPPDPGQDSLLGLMDLGGLALDAARAMVRDHLSLIFYLLMACGLVWLAVVYLTSRFTFVFYDAIVQQDGDGSFRASLKTHLKNSRSYFLVTACLELVLLASVARYLVLPLLEALKNGSDLEELLDVLSGPGPLMAVFLSLQAIKFLNQEFIVPLMAQKQEGILSAWMEFFRALNGHWGEFGLYGLLRFALRVAGVVVTLVLLVPVILALGALVLVLFLVVMGVFKLFSVGQTQSLFLTMVLVSPVAMVGILYGLALAYLPTAAFLRLYSVKFLDRVQGNVMVLPENLF